jgi:DNA-binding MarR family transcriptional regulator
MEKTKVSRAVTSMEAEGLLTRARDTSDRRAEVLTLTDRGRAVFADLGQEALAYDRALRAELGAEATAALERALAVMAARRGA